MVRFHANSGLANNLADRKDDHFNVDRMKYTVIKILNYKIINTLDMKNKLWETIKSRRFLYALLTAMLLYAFAVGSSRLLAYLIPWRLLEVVVWFVVYFGLLVLVIWNWDDWFGKHCS